MDAPTAYRRLAEIAAKLFPVAMEMDWQYADGDVCEECERTLFRPETIIVSADNTRCLCLACAPLAAKLAQVSK